MGVQSGDRPHYIPTKKASIATATTFPSCETRLRRHITAYHRQELVFHVLAPPMTTAARNYSRYGRFLELYFTSSVGFALATKTTDLPSDYINGVSSNSLDVPLQSDGCRLLIVSLFSQLLRETAICGALWSESLAVKFSVKSPPSSRD
jgi:hypothetical protein